MLNIDKHIIEALDEYHQRSLMIQQVRYDKVVAMDEIDLMLSVDDDLIYHVPIYDMLDRKYAAFSSFPEAIVTKEKDPKGHGIRFLDVKLSDDNFIKMLYLFRLCGSGINYKPGSHGFGNFWIVKSIESGRTEYSQWMTDLPNEKFCDNKGYLLPQFKGGLKQFILDHAESLVSDMIDDIHLYGKCAIKEIVDVGNGWLNKRNFNKQWFVLSAFAADLAEYFPDMIDRKSMIYAGTNAKKCIKAIFGKCNEEEAIQFLADRYKAPPYSVEDSRLCDPVRYFLDYQSKHHIEANSGSVYQNNSILKKIWTSQRYQNFQSQLQK